MVPTVITPTILLDTVVANEVKFVKIGRILLVNGRMSMTSLDAADNQVFQLPDDIKFWGNYTFMATGINGVHFATGSTYGTNILRLRRRTTEFSTEQWLYVNFTLPLA